MVLEQVLEAQEVPLSHVKIWKGWQTSIWHLVPPKHAFVNPKHE